MITLNVPLFSWIVIVVAVVVFVLATLLGHRKIKRHRLHHHARLLEFGREADELYIPGDPVPGMKDSPDSDYDD